MTGDGLIRSRKVLDSARGKPCTARLPGICNNNPETTVWAHLNGHAFGKGLAVKAHDVLGFHACSSCHAYYDFGHGTRPQMSEALLLECVLEAVTATWVRLIRDGVVFVPQDAVKPRRDRASKPRKPPEQRAKIASASNWPPKGSRKIQQRNDLRKAGDIPGRKVTT